MKTENHEPDTMSATERDSPIASEPFCPRGPAAVPEPKSAVEFERAYSDWKAKWNDTRAFGISDGQTLAKAEKEWIVPFLNQERRCTAILQRRACLQKILNHGGYQLFNSTAFRGITEEDKKDIKKDIEDLTRMYWDSNGILSTMWSRRPRALNVTELEILREHKTPKGHTYAGMMDRGRCADWGGCCARACGCCEKALFSYQRPLAVEDTKEEVQVFGHCTQECDCCEHTGRVDGEPHPGLPLSGVFAK